MRRATARRASTSRPESISSRTANLGRRTPSCTVSLRLRSPPDRSTLSGRDRNRSSKPTRAASAPSRAATSARSRPWAANASPRASTSDTPGHLDRVLHGQEQPGLGPLPRRQGQQVLAVEGDPAADHLVAGPAHQHVGQRALARAVGAHHGVDLAAAHLEVDAAQDLLAGRPSARRSFDHAATLGSARSRHPRRRRPRRATSYTGTGLVAGSDWGLPSTQRERAAVLPALDLALLGVDLALGQREVGVAAPVADGVEVVADAHQAHAGAGRRRSAGPCPARSRRDRHSRSTPGWPITGSARPSAASSAWSSLAARPWRSNGSSGGTGVWLERPRRGSRAR